MKLLLVVFVSAIVAVPGTNSSGFGIYFLIRAGLISTFGGSWAIISTVQSMMIDDAIKQSG